MPSPSIAKIAKAKEAAAAGVDFSPRTGASCPWCGEKTKVVTTKPWEDGLRIRYHRCEHAGCVLAVMGLSIKSIQVDHDADREVVVIGR